MGFAIGGSVSDSVFNKAESAAPYSFAGWMTGKMKT